MGNKKVEFFYIAQSKEYETKNIFFFLLDTAYRKPNGKWVKKK